MKNRELTKSKINGKEIMSFHDQDKNTTYLVSHDLSILHQCDVKLPIEAKPEVCYFPDTNEYALIFAFNIGTTMLETLNTQTTMHTSIVESDSSSWLTKWDNSSLDKPLYRATKFVVSFNAKRISNNCSLSYYKTTCRINQLVREHFCINKRDELLNKQYLDVVDFILALKITSITGVGYANRKR